MEPLLILAAGQGTRLRPHTDSKPKCMVPLAGRPLLHWQMDAATRAGCNDITVIGGYRHDGLDVGDHRLLLNERFATTNMVETLWCAEHVFGDGFLVSYGDIVYEPEVLARLAASEYDVAVVVDRCWRSYWEQRTDDVLADAESLQLDSHGRIVSIGQRVDDIEAIQGQYIGLIALRRSALAVARTLINEERRAHACGKRLMCLQRALPNLYMTDLLQALIKYGVNVWPVWTDGRWLEIDTYNDLMFAERLVAIVDGRLSIQRK